MASAPKDEVRILPPDLSLQKKIGTGSLDKLLSPQIVESAQKVIVGASDQMLEDCLAEASHIELAAKNVGSSPEKTEQALRELTDSAFSLKAKAGLGGYDLISMLAKSLNQYCEQCDGQEFTPANLTIIKWHVGSLRKLLDLKIKGTGGTSGEAILLELQKLGVSVDDGASE